ncbi:MAG: hypothetical protein ACK4X1_11990, partial [Terricaulis sp.]
MAQTRTWFAPPQVRNGPKTRWSGVALALAVLAVAGAGCVQATLRVDTRERRPIQITSLLSQLNEDPAVTSAAEWSARRAPLLRAAFQDRIYGWLPAEGGAHVTARRLMVTGAYPDARSVEEV